LTALFYIVELSPFRHGNSLLGMENRIRK